MKNINITAYKFDELEQQVQSRILENLVKHPYSYEEVLAEKGWLGATIVCKDVFQMGVAYAMPGCVAFRADNVVFHHIFENYDLSALEGIGVDGIPALVLKTCIEEDPKKSLLDNMRVIWHTNMALSHICNIPSMNYSSEIAAVVISGAARILENIAKSEAETIRLLLYNEYRNAVEDAKFNTMYTKEGKEIDIYGVLDT